MTGGPSSISCFMYFYERKVWAQGDIWSSGIYLPDGFGFPFNSGGLFSVYWLLGLVFAFLSDFDLEESLPRSSLRLPTSGAC